jgi:hypothetical protein
VTPPTVATWLLVRFGSPRNREVVAGDLSEQFQAGRSASWYWRQALSAVALGAITDIRGHKARAVLALLTAYGAMCLFYFPVSPFWDSSTTRDFVMRAWAWMWGPPVHMKVLHWWAALLDIPGMLWIGWCVGRLHRPYRTAMVPLATLFIVVLQIPRLYWIIGNAMTGSGYGEALDIHLAGMVFTVIGMLSGGLWNPESNDASVVKHSS